MSIYVETTLKKMPKCCGECVYIKENYPLDHYTMNLKPLAYCSASTEYGYINCDEFDIYSDRYDWCPLVKVDDDE